MNREQKTYYYRWYCTHCGRQTEDKTKFCSCCDGKVKRFKFLNLISDYALIHEVSR